MTKFPNDAAMAELQDRGVDFIIVHGALFNRTEYRGPRGATR